MRTLREDNNDRPGENLGGTPLDLLPTHLPIGATPADGAWATDASGRRYLDCLALNSAVSFGHSNSALLAAAHERLDSIALTGTAFPDAQFDLFADDLATLAGKELALPMATAVEAVAAAVAAVRSWGRRVKGIDVDRANVIVAGLEVGGAGIRRVTYGDADAIAAAVDENTVAVLVEPIRAEAGIVVPPAAYLPAVRELATRFDVLLIADETHSGLGRTGKTFACELVDVVPDLYLLGNALGGGIVPAAAVVGDGDVLGAIARVGGRGRGFGGNPLAAAIGRAVVGLLETGELQERAQLLGTRMLAELDRLVGRGVLAVRGVGVWVGVDIDPLLASADQVCERLARRGLLATAVGESTIRLSPPIVVDPADIDWAVAQLESVLEELVG
ncbi:aminotransferase class III-fold pyridoxal phosphate-dependent enzyme [Rathayibacter soli]|uniref:aminotransferase class III-fold pyridoxal phosphate-dependent enzyme n=1 Tax=Rathayibacter soli TaxID=3144168 RepID=UPI0027E4106B|nr:aminotransferase class III-fold pyridoxal phosphate-dependent enzyme [Glaciibacter superstes]